MEQNNNQPPRLGPQSKISRKLRFSFSTILVSLAVAALAVILIRVYTNNTELNSELSTENSSATTTEIASGSYIVDMGSTVPTIENSLLPYGLVYALTQEGVPVHWVINENKATDGVDFTYAGNDFHGGPFIIDASYITPSVQNLISTWESKGVLGTYTIEEIEVPVYETITTFSISTIDDGKKADIIKDYFELAEIPPEAYKLGLPDTLGACDEVYLFPHADPTWEEHSNLKTWNLNQKGFIWAACHAISILENLHNPENPSDKMNFLTTNGLQCYSGNECGNITEKHAGSSTPPFTVNAEAAADPFMQFIGTTGEAHDAGSERWYIPTTTSSWNSNVMLGVYTSDGSGDRKGAHIAYGRGFDDPNRGMIMYESGHKVNDSGTEAEQVNAMRVMFNFILMASLEKAIHTTAEIPSIQHSGMTSALSISPTNGTPPYTYDWSSDCLASTFSDTKVSNPDFTMGENYANKTCTIKVLVTDACGRKVIYAQSVSAGETTFPVEWSDMKLNPDKNGTQIIWEVASETNNLYFEVQKSLNGVAFEEIGNVESLGNTQTPRTYSFQDNSITNFQQEKIYYRIKQVDLNGTFTFSKVLSMDLSESVAFSFDLYPNPARDYVEVSFKNLSLDSQTNIQIINIDGKLVLQQTVEKNKSNTTLQLGDISAGIYTVRVFSDEEIYTKKLVIN